MSNDKRYDGWTNYETWAVKLWMDNDESTYDYWRERSREVLTTSTGDAICTAAQRARYDLADELKREHEENAPDLSNTVYSDLLSAALSEVNWYEIAESLLEDAREQLVRDGEMTEAEGA